MRKAVILNHIRKVIVKIARIDHDNLGEIRNQHWYHAICIGILDEQQIFLSGGVRADDNLAKIPTHKNLILIFPRELLGHKEAGALDLLRFILDDILSGKILRPAYFNRILYMMQSRRRSKRSLKAVGNSGKFIIDSGSIE